MDNISDWVADEILLKHSKAVHYLLNRLQALLAGGRHQAAGQHQARCGSARGPHPAPG